jgi:hypothetical protein
MPAQCISPEQKKEMSSMSNGQRLEVMISRLPERERWKLLQNAIDSKVELDDRTVRSLDSRMQGLLFLQDHITNRKARIEFARSKEHMPYLREAAGSRNVWMTDKEFTELVEKNDSETLACFARSEEMRPHQLIYIEYKLTVDPHRQESLATAYDAMIAAKKAIEIKGRTGEVALIRLAKAALEGSADVETLIYSRDPGAVMVSKGDPRALWRAYLNLRRLDRETLLGLMKDAGASTISPVLTSRLSARAVH